MRRHAYSRRNRLAHGILEDFFAPWLFLAFTSDRMTWSVLHESKTALTALGPTRSRMVSPDWLFRNTAYPLSRLDVIDHREASIKT